MTTEDILAFAGIPFGIVAVTLAIFLIVTTIQYHKFDQICRSHDYLSIEMSPSDGVCLDVYTGKMYMPQDLK